MENHIGDNDNHENNGRDVESNTAEKSEFELCNKQNTSTMVNKRNANSLFNKKFYYYMISFAQICVLIYTIIISYFCFIGEFIFFTWHPLLMSIGWFVLMTQAILIVSKQDFLTRNIPHQQRIQFHWILQSVGAVLTTAAFVVVVLNKINLNKHHFKTWHALLGLTAFIFCLIACLSGAAALYNTKLTRYVSPRINKQIHIVCGITTFLFGGLTMILSVYTKWYSRKSNESETIFAFGLLTVVSAIVLTSYKSVVNLSKRSYQLFS